MVTAGSSARAFGHWAAGLCWEDLPHDVRRRTVLRLVDVVGLVVVGAASDIGKATITAALREGAGGDCFLLGAASRRVARTSAAMVHGTLAHSWDFDDTHLTSLAHPGAVVIPTALALAQCLDSSDEEFGAAVVAGYELTARLGQVFGTSLMAKGFHATGVIGPLAAAVTAGKLQRLDAEQIRAAMGIAASTSAGLMAFVGGGGWTKALHAGWSARAGMVAADLAASGFRAPEDGIAGTHGLVHAFLGELPSDTSACIQQDLGSTWREQEVAFKHMPCAHVIQPYAWTALQLLRANGMSMEDVQSIVCTMPTFVAELVALPRATKLRPDSDKSAFTSLPYIVSSCVVDGHVGVHSLSATSRSRADVLALAHKVQHRVDPELASAFAGSVEITTRSGLRFAETVSMPEDTADSLEDKYMRNVACAAGAEGSPVAGLQVGAWCDAAHQALRREAPSWRSFVKHLSGPM